MAWVGRTRLLRVSLGFWFGPLLQTLLIVGAAMAVAVIVSRSRPPGESPLEILRRRYAAGEISKQEFEATRRALGV